MASRASPSPPAPDDRLPWEDLLTIRRCFVYNVPSREGHLSYYCEAWGLDTPIFTGELHLLAKQQYLHLRLSLDGQTFADSIWLDCATVGHPVPLESFIEGARDSSRYFVIRVGDAGLKPKRVVPIGVGFRERSQAFDLMAAIRDRINLVQRQGGAEDDMAKLGIDDAKEIEAAEAKSDAATPLRQRSVGPALAAHSAETLFCLLCRLAAHSQDLSLKAGVRIKVAVKPRKKQSGAAEGAGEDEGDDTEAAEAAGSGSRRTEPSIALVQKAGGLLLAPPPDLESSVAELEAKEKERGKKKKSGRKSAQQQQADESLAPAPSAAAPPAADDDDFGDFTSAS